MTTNQRAVLTGAGAMSRKWLEAIKTVGGVEIIGIVDINPANAEARAAGSPMRVMVKQECRPGSEEVSETTTREGVQVVSICQKRIYASAVMGLKEARAEIAGNSDIPEDTRKQLLRTLDAQISRWSSGRES